MASQLSFRISPNVLKTLKPPIPQVFAWSWTYQGPPEAPLIDMSQGVPGIPPPSFLLETLAKYAADPATCGYTSTAGEMTFRAAFAEELKITYGDKIDINKEDVAFTAGCNMAFVASIIALADAGDEVILPTPWYFNNQMTLDMLGINTVCLPTCAEDGFVPSVERCEKLITSKTRAICFVTPNNPSGAIYPPDVLKGFARLAKAHGIALILDETYRGAIAGTLPHRLFETTEDWNWRSTVIHLYSFSKSYSVPGHRIGAVIASPEMIGHIVTVLDCLLICAPRAIQLALCDNLVKLRPFIKDNAVALKSRHDTFRTHLPKEWKIGSQGGYFAFVRHPFKGIPAIKVSERLAVESGVMTLPAQFFLSEEDSQGESGRWVRFSVVNVDEEKVRTVCQRLSHAQETYGWEID